MASAEEIAWAAGLFDGEGSITHTDRDLQALLKNTDLELVTRFDAIVGRGRVYGPYEHSGRDGFVRTPYWMWIAHGDAAHEAVEVLAPWLSRRPLEQRDSMESTRHTQTKHVKTPMGRTVRIEQIRKRENARSLPLSQNSRTDRRPGYSARRCVRARLPRLP